MTSSCDIHNIR